jgi:hypothetical protein
LLRRVAKPPSRAAHEAALLAMLGEGFRLEPANSGGTPVRLGVVAARGLALSMTGLCVRAVVVRDPATLIVVTPPGVRVRLSSSSRLAGSLWLGHDLPPSRRIGINLEPGLARDVVIPDVGDGGTWQLAVVLPSDARRTVVACGTRPENADT